MQCANRVTPLQKQEETFGEDQMTEGNFDSKTLAKMNFALDRICETVPRGEQHSVRKRIAREIIKCARSGKTTLSELTSAGERVLHEVPPQQGSRLGAAPEAPAKYE
jgi:dephospho-CoA kinase